MTLTKSEKTLADSKSQMSNYVRRGGIILCVGVALVALYVGKGGDKTDGDILVIPRTEPVVKNEADVVKFVRRDKVTIVTGYFNLGDHDKHDMPKRTVNNYLIWMEQYKYMNNPVVGFFDTVEARDHFLQIRSTLPKEMTKAIMFDRSKLWAFSFKDRVAEIFAQDGYPKFPPQTTEPNYACAMNTKYDFLETAIRENFFNTTFFSWVDIGIYRRNGSDQPFQIFLPPLFDSRRVAFNMVSKRNASHTPIDIIRNNGVWLSGGFIFGAGEVLLEWMKEYKHYLYKLLDLGVMGSDEQVIYAIPTYESGKRTMSRLIQAYEGRDENDVFFAFAHWLRRIGALILEGA